MAEERKRLSCMVLNRSISRAKAERVLVRVSRHDCGTKLSKLSQHTLIHVAVLSVQIFHSGRKLRHRGVSRYAVRVRLSSHQRCERHMQTYSYSPDIRGFHRCIIRKSISECGGIVALQFNVCNRRVHPCLNYRNECSCATYFMAAVVECHPR
jgi:hypothetical protein